MHAIFKWKLEKTQKEDLNITEWLEWYLDCLHQAINNSKNTLQSVFDKSSFWREHSEEVFNPRQIKMLKKLLDGFQGKLTTSKWATITKCSQDTAHRDMVDLIGKDILVKDNSGGRSTNYLLKE